MSDTVVTSAMSKSERRGACMQPLWLRQLGLPGEGEEPECLFRQQPWTRVLSSVRPTLQSLVRRVAVPTLYRQHQRLGLELRMSGDVNTNRVQQLVRLLLLADGKAARGYIADLQSDGLSLDTILLRLLRGAEVALEQQFDQDRCSSLDATLAICQLRTLATELTQAQHRASRCHLSVQRRVFTIPCAGDSLRFAPILHDCYLRMAGWDVVPLAADTSLANLATMLRRQQPDVVLWVLNDTGRASEQAMRIRKLRAMLGERAPTPFLGTGDGFAPYVLWPQQSGVEAIVSEPAQTLLMAADSQAA
jgi:hypothetical protein